MSRVQIKNNNLNPDFIKKVSEACQKTILKNETPIFVSYTMNNTKEFVLASVEFTKILVQTFPNRNYFARYIMKTKGDYTNEEVQEKVKNALTYSIPLKPTEVWNRYFFIPVTGCKYQGIILQYNNVYQP